MSDEGGRGRIQLSDELHLLQAALFDGRLARGSVAVFAAILKHCDAGWHAFPGVQRIADIADLAPKNARKSIKQLEDLGYIRVIRPGSTRPNRYQVLERGGVTDRPAAPAPPRPGGAAAPRAGSQRRLSVVERVKANIDRARRERGGPIEGEFVRQESRPAGAGEAWDASIPSRGFSLGCTRPPAWDAGVPQLGMPASTEDTLEGTFESAGAAGLSQAVEAALQEPTGATRPLPEQETPEQRQKRSERQICENFEAARATDPRLAKLMEENYRVVLSRHGLVGNATESTDR